MTSCARAVLFPLLVSAPLADADETELPDAKPIPSLRSVPLPRGAISIQRDGREVTRFHTDATTGRRPFWYPVVADKADRSLTRMGHPHDPHGHSHHNSVWISHHDVDGVNFWADRGKVTGQIVHQRTTRLWDANGRYGAGGESVFHWTSDAGGEVLLVETRRWEWRDRGGGFGSMLCIDLEFSPPAGREKTTFKETPFGLIGVRMAKTIGVRDGGGRILNSEGDLNEKEVFRKPARWVDYSGPLARGGKRGGITLLDHPDNPGHPNAFHVRDDGWMGVCLTLGGPIEVTEDKPLKVRYALWVHDGVAAAKDCEVAWKELVRLPAPGED